VGGGVRVGVAVRLGVGVFDGVAVFVAVGVAGLSIFPISPQFDSVIIMRPAVMIRIIDKPAFLPMINLLTRIDHYYLSRLRLTSDENVQKDTIGFH
jgi:hypothetical protein